ncbi:hypothetical protein NQ317_000735 [Molorchus minor]|uniref:Uncharacterized protein n=1 Tax=Molorchus minor TaxID=1323400 RepID=A0ABQ9JHP8_9CUCU|nr:hypothetical protein NQ317_000735 [Molorchus minor]
MGCFTPCKTHSINNNTLMSPIRKSSEFLRSRHCLIIEFRFTLLVFDGGLCECFCYSSDGIRPYKSSRCALLGQFLRLFIAIVPDPNILVSAPRCVKAFIKLTNLEITLMALIAFIQPPGSETPLLNFMTELTEVPAATPDSILDPFNCISYS